MKQELQHHNHHMVAPVSGHHPHGLHSDSKVSAVAIHGVPEYYTLREF